MRLLRLTILDIDILGASQERPIRAEVAPPHAGTLLASSSRHSSRAVNSNTTLCAVGWRLDAGGVCGWLLL
jgi:hypothetical protein